MFAVSGFRILGFSSRSSYCMCLLAAVTIIVAIFFERLLIQPNDFPVLTDFGNSARRVLGGFSGFAKRSFTNGFSGAFNAGSGFQDPSGATAHNQFVYKAAVAYQPKDRDDSYYKGLNESLRSPTGEDNFFVQANSFSDVYAGVADGVGGWASHGYDSSAISRELCKALAEISSTFNPEKELQVSPKELLDLAYSKVLKDGIVKVGGTTAVVTHFTNNGTFKVANLGDSWCGVFRDSKLIYKTEFQTVGFNAPYQLSIIPEAMAKEAAKRGRSFIHHEPSDADEYTFQLQENDIVMLATDGVTDNIATEDIEIFLRDNESKIDKDLRAVTDEFVRNVVKLSRDPNFPSVFSQEYSRLKGKEYRGGKEDDITVVMVRVGRE